jgi:hypothetical protein
MRTKLINLKSCILLFSLLILSSLSNTQDYILKISLRHKTINFYRLIIDNENSKVCIIKPKLNNFDNFNSNK